MAVIKDVRVLIRFNIVSDEIIDQETGGHFVKGKGHGHQQKLIGDAPPMEMSVTELETRLTNAAYVFENGCAVGNVPPQVQTADASAVTKTTATINGFVKSPNGNAHVGFKLGINRELGVGAVTTNEGNTGGIVTTWTHRTYSWAGLTAGTKYYYRFYSVDAADAALIQYGIIKSFTTLPA
ncbi:MAG: hypothetical protein ABSA76_06275 [Bacteroidales bacterium]